MPAAAMTAEAEEDHRPSFFRWCLCQCRKIRLVNDRLFIVAPMMAMGSSLSEIVVVFSITGFMNLDMVAVSSVSLCLLLAFATLLFIRFDRLTLLAYLMLCVSILSSSTFFMISYENHSATITFFPWSSSRSSQSHKHFHPHPTDGMSTTSTNIFNNNYNYNNNNHDRQQQPHQPIDNVYPGFVGGGGLIESPAPISNSSRHGKKLFDLMKGETELRWIHQIQSTNKCCGFWNYTDWVDPHRLQDSNKSYVYFSTEPISPPPKWVTSCCDRTLSRDNNKCRSDSVYDDWKDVVQYLFPEGCGSLLDDGLDRVQQEMLKTSMGLLFWDILILTDIIAYTIWRKLKSQSGDDDDDCQRNGNIRDCGNEEDDVFT